MGFKKAFLVMIAVSLSFLWSCGPQAVAPIAALDTPEHHHANGDRFLEAGMTADALNEFSRAVALDPKFSPGYLGMGLTYGQEGDFEKAIINMKAARRWAQDDAQLVAVLIGNMRLYLMGGKRVDKDWLKKVEHNYHQAVAKMPDNPKPYFYMGESYKTAFRMHEAAGQYKKVIALNKDLVAEADRAYAVIQKIERAMPGSEVGKTIAFLDALTRAETAALLMQELSVDEIYRRYSPQKYDRDFKSPQQFKAAETNAAPLARDIAGHVLKADIDAVLVLGIKGLGLLPDMTFRPDSRITRAEFAMILEDILIKITRDDSLATKFIGSRSAFADVRNDVPYFNAVMVCTTRNLMEVRDAGSGEFAPLNPVSGADALLSLRTLKTQMEKY